MNIFSKLPFLDGKTEDDVEVEPTEAELKAERIAFHRAKVRNGPVKFGQMTNGQVRRAEKRIADRRAKKAYRAEVRNYFEKQQLAAAVRGHLRLAGVLPLVGDRPLDRTKQVTSTAWLVQRFGVQIEVDGHKTGRVSFAHDDVLEALSRALKVYGPIVGLPNLQVPAGYVVPIYTVDSSDADLEASA